MPKSKTTIVKMVMDFATEKKNEISKSNLMKCEKKQKFSITVDEWSDIDMRRYLNVTLQSADSEIVLGLVPIIGSCTSQKTEQLVSEKLIEFGIELDKDIVTSTNDGASVMIKYGRIISPESQCCYNHAIHLSVIDTFYKKQVHMAQNQIDGESEESSNESDNFENEEEQFRNDDLFLYNLQDIHVLHSN